MTSPNATRPRVTSRSTCHSRCAFFILPAGSSTPLAVALPSEPAKGVPALLEVAELVVAGARRREQDDVARARSSRRGPHRALEIAARLVLDVAELAGERTGRLADQERA